MKAFDRLMVVLYLVAAVLPFAAMKLGWHDHEIFGSLPRAPDPKPSLEAVRSEEFQKGYTAWFETGLGFKGFQIATDNSLLYHLFRDTKSGSQVMLGKDGFLFKDEDLAYYNKTGAQLPDQARVDALADKVATMQTRMQHQRRAFVPLIIPSKTTLYRDKVADLWTRDLGDPRPSDQQIYVAFKRALDARKVAYVDAREMFMSGQTPRDMLWGIDGRHWSVYGSCLALREVTRVYAELTNRASIGYDCPVKRAAQPRSHDDFDLWRLLNVWGLARQPKTIPVVSHGAPAPGAFRPSLLLIGTSFQWELLRHAGSSQLFGKLYMNYYNKVFVVWPADAHLAVKPHTDEWRGITLDNDLYVLDLFEVYLLAPDTYVDEVLAEIGSELDAADESLDPTTGATISDVHDLGVTDGAHHFELWGSFPGTQAYDVTVTCDGVRRKATVYYQNPNGQQLNVHIPDPGPGACDRQQTPPAASGVSCTFRVKQGAAIGAPPFGPRRVCPGPQGSSGQDADGRCQAGLAGC